ncbi:tricarboxylic transporter [Gammaproteobacteria bacterium]|jgi:putative tricarboxylic transport membrane protein|nr:tricarboxylic transporter [Gammaproteobacteria bacterium]
MPDSLFVAADYLSQGANLGYLVLGVAVGIVFGSIPGLGGATAIALLLPLTFGMEPDQAVILMGGIMGAVSIGGSVSAILLNTPGTAPNAATCIDGYPLTRQGKAGLAIGAAATASSIGGIISLGILVAVLPVARTIVLWFGPPAFFMLAVLGLTSLTVASGNLLRGLIAACIGLFFGFVGYDDIGGTARYTIGIDFLWDGISIVPLLIGLFAIAEMMNLYRTGGPISASDDGDTVKVVGTMDGVRSVFANLRTLISGSAIGTVIGLVPGVGGTVASFLSYSFAAQTSKNNENFGSGDIRGVIAPEAANNAKDGGALIPTLAFGIPGSAEMAIFLGVLILHGIDPGPMLLIERESTIFMLILALLVATLISGGVILTSARHLARIAHIDSMLLIPCVITVSFVGAYALHGSIGDVFIAAFFGMLGFVMIRFDYPRITLVIAFVLSGLMERNFIQSMIMFEGDWRRFFGDTTTLVLFLLTLCALLIPIVNRVRTRRSTR